MKKYFEKIKINKEHVSNFRKITKDSNSIHFKSNVAKKMGFKDKVIQGTNGILNGKVLRFHNEPVRHKTLDLIGDLALLGISIKGHVTAARSGHESNVEFVKMIKKEYKEQLENNIP